jgi:hypothetical protein
LLSFLKMCTLHSSAPLDSHETKCSETSDKAWFFFIFSPHSYLVISWEHVQEWEHFTVGRIIHGFCLPSPMENRPSYMHCLDLWNLHTFSIFCSFSSLVQCWLARLETRLLWLLLHLGAFVLQLPLPLLFIWPFF